MTQTSLQKLWGLFNIPSDVFKNSPERLQEVNGSVPRSFRELQRSLEISENSPVWIRKVCSSAPKILQRFSKVTSRDSQKGIEFDFKKYQEICENSPKRIHQNVSKAHYEFSSSFLLSYREDPKSLRAVSN